MSAQRHAGSNSFDVDGGTFNPDKNQSDREAGDASSLHVIKFAGMRENRFKGKITTGSYRIFTPIVSQRLRLANALLVGPGQVLCDIVRIDVIAKIIALPLQKLCKRCFSGSVRSSNYDEGWRRNCVALHRPLL